VVAATAVLALVSPGSWGSWQAAGNRAGSLQSAALGYSLAGTNVTGGGTGYSWNFLLSLAGKADNLSITNTGSVPETISATVAITGVGASATLYGCTNAFTGTPALTCTGRLTLGSVSHGSPASITLATTLAAGGTYNLAVNVPGLLGLTVTVTMSSFVITPRTGTNRTTS
jgi:hypothetical protein